MPGILFYSLYDDAEEWNEQFSKYLPNWTFNKWPVVNNPNGIEIALVWKPPRGELKKYRNLQLIVNLGAGIDSLLEDDQLPSGIPIIRLTDRAMIEMMVQYVLLSVLSYHRNLPDFARAQQQRVWRYIHPRQAHHTHVGILGLGSLGVNSATELKRQGFTVSGWSRSHKVIDGVKTYQGEIPHKSWLSTLDILVVLLPLTMKTRGLVDRNVIYSLPRGSKIISVGRGAVLSEPELFNALENGHIGAATIDTFSEEPLPHDHYFWSIPNVTITPHVASVVVPESCMEQITDAIRSIKEGRLPKNIVDPKEWY